MRVSSEAAPRSITISAFSCVCINEAGQVSDVLLSTAAFTMPAFSSPHAVTYSLRAFKMVLMPMVMLHGGTCSPLAKLFVISSRDSGSIKMIRVGEAKLEPGSLTAMLPLRPMPKRAASRPPKVCMRCSYKRQLSCTASCDIVPSGVKIFCCSMSTLSRKRSFSCFRQLFEFLAVNGKYS